MAEASEVARIESPYAKHPVQQGGAVAVEQQRAVAEAVAAMQIARANPRNQRNAMDLIITDCTMEALAEDAVYEYARGGTDISGPSIRLAETIARRWGNIRMGVSELARREGYSEVKAYAIDLETGTTDEKLFQVRHWRDRKDGKGYTLTDERDIYETIANQGARRKRACILAIIPQDVIDVAVRQCEVTMKTKMEITPDFINSIVESFAKIGVTQEMLEKRIQRRLDALTPALAVQLRRIRNSLRDGMSHITDWFEAPGAVPAGGEAPPQTASARMAEELKAKAGGSHQTTEERAAGSESRPRADGERTVSQPSTFEETGEITNASVRAAIAAADTQDVLTKIMMGDLMKLPANEARTVTMTLWNTRVMELKAKNAAPAASTAAPPGGGANEGAGSQPQPVAAKPAKAKPHGTARVKAALRKKMGGAVTQGALDEAAADISLYAWDENDKKDLYARYQECKVDLDSATQA